MARPHRKSKGNTRYTMEPDSEEEEEEEKPRKQQPKKEAPLKRPLVHMSEDSDTDEGSEEQLCEYELIRKRNIEERNKFLKELGMDKLVSELNEVAPKHKPKEAPKKRQILPKPPIERREPSRRIRNLAAKAEIKVEETEPTEDRMLDSVKLEEDSLDLFEDLASLSSFDFNPQIDLSKCSIDDFRKTLMCLPMNADIPKVVVKRIQSIAVHPSHIKRIVFAGSVSGSLGIWDLDGGEQKNLLECYPHTAPTNCISVSSFDTCKVYSTSHDGTFCCTDLRNHITSNVFATDGFRNHHLTWHAERDFNTIFLGRGDGCYGALDLREPVKSKQPHWVSCFKRSVRTVQFYPNDNNYILLSSGTGACSVFDVRSNERKAYATPVCDLDHPKGLTSAFFSPDGTKVVSTCNDDQIRVFELNQSFTKHEVLCSVVHNNHTGRFLSVFKANFHPARSDVFLVGSLLHPRRIQVYGVNGKLLGELRSEDMTTISPVIAAHPLLPFVVGGNSSGRVHAFTSPPS